MSNKAMRLSFRLRARLRVRRICLGNTDDRAQALVATLGPLEGRMPLPSPHGILYACCNDSYFERYARVFIRSARENSPSQSLHLHLFDPSPSTLAALDSIGSDAAFPLTFSWERLSRADAALTGGLYFVCARFVRLWQLLEAARSPILAVDCDTVIRNPLTHALRQHEREDIALYLRLEKPEWRRVLGAAVLARPTLVGRRFMRDCAATFVECIHSEALEATDQLILYLLWRWYQRHVPGFLCGALTRRFSDWHYEDASLIWHEKGSGLKGTLPVWRLFGEAQND